MDKNMVDLDSLSGYRPEDKELDNFFAVCAYKGAIDCQHSNALPSRKLFIEGIIQSSPVAEAKEEELVEICEKLLSSLGIQNVVREKIIISPKTLTVLNAYGTSAAHDFAMKHSYISARQAPVILR